MQLEMPAEAGHRSCLSSVMNQKMGCVCKPYSIATLCRRTARSTTLLQGIHLLAAREGGRTDDLTVGLGSHILMLIIFNESKIILLAW